MFSFLSQLFRDFALLFVASLPVVLLARSRGRIKHARNYIIAALVVAIVTSVIAFSSQRLVEDCFNAGNQGCEDVGSSGMRMLFFGGFILVALVEAWLIAHD